jgi:alpha-D-ribose 1-methylphosphonate 5-triphosphate synthase subunit PhnH
MRNFQRSCLDNHHCFRVLLQAMSRPGRIFQLPRFTGNAKDALLGVLGAILDPQVSYCLLDFDPDFENRLQIRTGARATKPENADFLLAPSGTSHGKLRRAKGGRLEYPDEGATVLFAVASLSEGTAETGLPLSGPGIKTSHFPRIEGLDVAELEQLKEVNREYPLGIDSIFVDRYGHLLCIPRSTRIGES